MPESPRAGPALAVRAGNGDVPGRSTGSRARPDDRADRLPVAANGGLATLSDAMKRNPPDSSHEPRSEGRAASPAPADAGGVAVLPSERPEFQPEQPEPVLDRLELEARLEAAEAAATRERERAEAHAARIDALLRAAAALRGCEEPEEAAERALDILRGVSELRLGAVGLPDDGGASTLVRGFARRGQGLAARLDGRAVLLDLLQLAPDRRRVSESFVLEGFRATARGDGGGRAAGEWDLTAVFDGEPTALTPLSVEGREHGFVLVKASQGQELDERLLGYVELVSRSLAVALDALRRRRAERRRSRLQQSVSRLGRRLMKVREPERVLELAAEALRDEWPAAAVEWRRLEQRDGASRAGLSSAGLPPRLLRQPEGEGPRSFALAPASVQLQVPVRTPGGLRAQLLASADSIAAFAGLEPEDLSSFAKVVSGAYANAELFRREARSLERLGLVARVGRRAGDSLETAGVLAPALAELCSHEAFETVAVGRLDRARGKLVLSAQASRAGVRLVDGLATSIEKGLTGWVARTGRPILVPDVRRDVRYHAVSASTRAELCVPLTVLDRVVGVLDIQSSRVGAFDEEDLVVAEAVADQLARALHNAQLHEEVKRANRELRASERRKTSFLATVAHDLRTPLTSIRSAADVVLMYGEAPAEERQEFLEAIRDEAARLGRLVDDFLAQARIEGGELEFEIVEFRLDEMLDHFARLFERTAARRGVAVECRVESGLPAAVGDPERVAQVVANLLSNATKFTPDEGRIFVTAGALPAEPGQVLGRVLVEVADTGPGIQESDREEIFERFVSFDRDPNAPRGAGLGLPIARSLVEHQGGRLWCDRRDGGGAAFRFTLPAFLD